MNTINKYSNIGRTKHARLLIKFNFNICDNKKARFIEY